MKTVQKYEFEIKKIEDWLDNHILSPLNSFYDDPCNHEVLKKKIQKRNSLRIEMHRLANGNKPSSIMAAQMAASNND
jgi:hypothetical protein